ncbi:MAG: HfaB protein, partial [Acinetobacter sp.]
MLNRQIRKNISSVSAVLVLAQILTGCTGLASSNKKPVTLVQGPPITDIFTPFDMALSCLKGQLRHDVNFSVGAILDQTGKDLVTDGGTGKMVTQGAGDMVQSALFQAGVSLLNRRDPRIIESEAKWGIRDSRNIQASDYYVTGSINSLDF